MEIKNDTEFQRILSLSNVIWEQFALAMHRYYASSNPRASESVARRQFETVGYYFSETASEIVAGFREIYESGEAFDYDVSDYHPDYRHSRTRDQRTVEEMNANIRYLRLDKLAEDSVRLFLETIKTEVEESIGSYWKITNIRCMKYRQGAPCPPQGFHQDGWPNGLYKILIYTKPPNRENGTTEVVSPSGRPREISSAKSSWLLFAPGAVSHRPIMPAAGVREASRSTWRPHSRPIPVWYMAG